MLNYHHRFAATLVVALLIFTTQHANAGKPKVVATTADIGHLFEVIGADHIDLRTLAKGYQDPHYLEAKPSYISRMRGADILAYVGLELEVGWLPLLVEGSRNSALASGGSGNLPLSTGITVRDKPVGEVDRSRGDIHPLGNPHYWLNPHNQLIMAGTVADALAHADPEHSTDYESARASFEERLESKIEEWERQLAPLRGTKIICYHTQWEYLTDWMGLRVVDYVENRPGIPPSPRHLHELEQRMEREHISLILMSNYFDSAAVEKIAQSTGSQLLVMPPSIGGHDNAKDVFALFDLLVDRITEALTEEAPR